MSWSEGLESAEKSLREGQASEAFQAAFRALEICYSAQVELAHLNAGDDRFRSVLKHLLESRKIPKHDYDLADHLRQARNVVSHRFGFEPSEKETLSTIKRVRTLCARFAIHVHAVMAKPVRCAKLGDPIGHYLRHMREDGISQFPVVSDDGSVIGTLDERAVFERLQCDGGILDPDTKVRELMRKDVLPDIKPNASLEDARKLLAKPDVSALLILQAGKPTGILTKHDLLRNSEL